MTANADFQRTAKATQGFRDVAEKGAAEAKENLEKMAAAGGEAVHVLKDAYATNLKGAQDYSAKVLEFAQINVNSAFEYAGQVAAMKSPTRCSAPICISKSRRSPGKPRNSQQSPRR